MAAKKEIKAAPRRTVDAALRDAIAGDAIATSLALPEAPAALAEEVAAKAAATTPTLKFQKLSISVEDDLFKQLRVARVVDHDVSQSAFIETAIRYFLALPKDERDAALAGKGLRRGKPRKPAE